MFTEEDKCDILQTLENRNIGMIPCDILATISKNETLIGYIRWAIIPLKCKCDVYDGFVDRKDPYYRWLVARDNQIPSECSCSLFKKLANDLGEVVRRNVKDNDTILEECREEILEILRSHGDE